MPTLRRAMKKIFALALLCAGTMVEFASAQQNSFDWVRDNDQVVRLTPGLRQQMRVYDPGQGGSIKLDLNAQKPVTVAVIQRRDWNNAMQDPQAIHRDDVMDRLRYLCVQQHVVSTAYSCDLPASDDAMLLVIRDERPIERAVISQIGEALHMSRTANILAPANEVHLQYYRWGCVENCYPPEFRGVRLAKEKFEPNILKTYSLPLPEHDGEQVDVKLKSSVPMLVAVIPSDIAQQLYAKPDLLESAVAGGICQQRAAQSVNFGCQLNANGAAQSLILIPEPSAGIPKRGKTEIELTSVKCVANCRAWPAN
jgi:hypothetical protein